MVFSILIVFLYVMEVKCLKGYKNQLDRLTEEDFYVLREPLKSGRQSPDSLGAALLLAIFLQPLQFVLTHVVVASTSNYPFKWYIFFTHMVITIVLVILSIIYGISKVFRKQEKTQYLISIIVSQNLFGLYMFFTILYIIGSVDITVRSVMFVTFVTIALGVVLFILTCNRFLRLLQAGHYRKGSKKGALRSRFENKSHITPIVIGAIAIVNIVYFITKDMIFIDFERILISIIGIATFYTMIFVLPEQLVIFYCKHRFESFNFDENRNIKPLGIGMEHFKENEV